MQKMQLFTNPPVYMFQKPEVCLSSCTFHSLSLFPLQSKCHRCLFLVLCIWRSISIWTSMLVRWCILPKSLSPISRNVYKDSVFLQETGQYRHCPLVPTRISCSSHADTGGGKSTLHTQVTWVFLPFPEPHFGNGIGYVYINPPPCPVFQSLEGPPSMGTGPSGGPRVF